MKRNRMGSTATVRAQAPGPGKSVGAAGRTDGGTAPRWGTAEAPRPLGSSNGLGQGLDVGMRVSLRLLTI